MDFELLLALQETSALPPMNRMALLRWMKYEFTKEELSHINVGASACLVLHRVKDVANDVDGDVDTLVALQQMAKRRRLQVNTSNYLGNGFVPRLEICQGRAELFYDPATYNKVNAGIDEPYMVIDGIRTNTPAAIVAWYEYMVRTLNRPKDHANLALARQLI